ncbi:hypothetical protein CMV24_15840 [Pseudomonas plecoglossicida]|uniref:Uncharacterized protein n=1 Tax=Pseudomonas plecoglossicida TaxID=70775 RepID=A0A2A3M319_PSEDL|nr:hypothetical protein CMV24_15840 [Pseudomonas plecoglossicida]
MPGFPTASARPLCTAFCRSGLVSRKGCAAAPAIYVAKLKSWGCCAALSRHKALLQGSCAQR